MARYPAGDGEAWLQVSDEILDATRTKNPDAVERRVAPTFGHRTASGHLTERADFLAGIADLFIRMDTGWILPATSADW